MLRPTPVPDAERITATLRILATTDLHSHLLAYDYFTDQPLMGVGLVQTASLIRKLRADAPNCVLFDNGDFLQGGPLSDWIAEEDRRSPGQQHPMIAAMNALGYDAGTLGNHEFNYGLGFLQGTLKQATFPFVSANVTTSQAIDPADDTTFVPPYAILDRVIQTADGRSLPIRIGVIGFAPPQIVLWERLNLGSQVGTRDIVEAARIYVPRLRAAGADIVVALCHSGIGPEQQYEGMENAAVPLAAIPGIDAMLAGHTHQVFPGPDLTGTGSVNAEAGTIHGVPTVMPGFHGTHLGVIDLTLDHDANGWRVAAHSVHVQPVATRNDDNLVCPLVQTDSEIAALGETVHQALIQDIRQPIGQTAVALQSYLSLIGPDQSLQVLADAQRAYATKVLEDTPFADLPILSAVSPFRTGGRGGPLHYIEIPAGPLLRRHASELYPYPNAFCILAVPGAAVSDWLERSASIFRQVLPDQADQPLIDIDFPAYNFDMLDGVTYAIDPSQPPRTDPYGRVINPDAKRITNLRLNGRPIDPDETVLIATNSYRAGGGGGFAAAVGRMVVYQGDKTTRDVVLDHLRGQKALDPVVRPTWQFSPLPGTTAWFDTGLRASAYAAGIPGLTVISHTLEGFTRYALQF